MWFGISFSWVLSEDCGGYKLRYTIIAEQVVIFVLFGRQRDGILVPNLFLQPVVVFSEMLKCVPV